jgi:hypothetical protein
LGFHACVSHVSLDVQVHAEDPWDADRAVTDSDSAEEVADGRPEARTHTALCVHIYIYMCICKRGTAEHNDNAVSVGIERSECVRA